MQFSATKNRSWGDGPTLQVGDHFTRDMARFVKISPESTVELYSDVRLIGIHLRNFAIPDGGKFVVEKIYPDPNFPPDEIMIYSSVE